MTYSYICKSCRFEWEEEQSIKDNPLTKCPECEQETAQRQINCENSFILQGGGVGWYSSGYSSSK